LDARVEGCVPTVHAAARKGDGYCHTPLTLRLDTLVQHPHVALCRRMMSLGRSSSCHVQFQDPHVSNDLCRIHVRWPASMQCALPAVPGSAYCMLYHSSWYANPGRVHTQVTLLLHAGVRKHLAAEGVFALYVRLAHAVHQWAHPSKKREGAGGVRFMPFWLHSPPHKLTTRCTEMYNHWVHFKTFLERFRVPPKHRSRCRAVMS